MIVSSVWAAVWSVILPEVTIGEDAVVATGTAATEDLEPWTVVGRNPAKVIKKRVIRG